MKESQDHDNTPPTVEALFFYLQRTKMTYAYKALLAIKLAKSETETIARDSVADFFHRFYTVRQQHGRRLERSTVSLALSKEAFRQALNTPYQLFADEGFLHRDHTHFYLWQPLSAEERAKLYSIALDRLAAHYNKESREQIEAFVQEAERQ